MTALQRELILLGVFLPVSVIASEVDVSVEEVEEILK